MTHDVTLAMGDRRHSWLSTVLGQELQFPRNSFDRIGSRENLLFFRRFGPKRLNVDERREDSRMLWERSACPSGSEPERGSWKTTATTVGEAPAGDGWGLSRITGKGIPGVRSVIGTRPTEH